MLWVEIAFLVVLMVIFPVQSARGFPKLLREIAEGHRNARFPGYRETIIWEWALLAAALGIWFAGGRSLADLGFSRPEGWGFWVSAGLTLAAIVVLTLQVRQVGRSEEQQHELRAQMGGPLAFLPRAPHEKPLFNAVCVTAGVCEEILYRGWFLAVVGGWIGLPAAAVVGVIGFGALHLYAGKSVALRAGMLGAFFTVLYLVSGSLWVPIVLHIFVDWNTGSLSLVAFGGRSEPDASASPGPEDVPPSGSEGVS
ncbi:MAG: CPBP family intramembrane metalloprotease [Gemmatimonadetes bacterium]|nr:CPBP family intramembrane metalloprotease [Gemmatimonadota bacterium]